MPKIGYNVGKIENIFSRMISTDTFPTKSMLQELRKELNAFFTEAICVDVLYTRNTDNLFFGMQVVPVLDAHATLDIVLSDRPMKISKYFLELDSKLFQIGLDKKELTAILLHEIGHIVINDKPVKQVRMAIDGYFSSKDQVINLKNSAQYTQLLTFAIKDIIRKTSSLFFMSNDEVRADSFAVLCGYGDSLESALVKITTNAWGLSKSTKEPKLTILAWIVNLYGNVKLNRIPAIHTLKKAKTATGSALAKRDIDDVINCLNKIDTDIIKESTALLDEAHKKGIISQIKYNGLKAMDNDYYEYRLRVKNLNSEEDSIYLMRQLNSRLSLIYDTLEEDLPDNERTRWQDLYERYLELRAQVAAHKISRKNYGLWFDYDALDPEQQQQSMYS